MSPHKDFTSTIITFELVGLSHLLVVTLAYRRYLLTAVKLYNDNQTHHLHVYNNVITTDAVILVQIRKHWLHMLVFFYKETHQLTT